jgi:hypothetical protein
MTLLYVSHIALAHVHVQLCLRALIQNRKNVFFTLSTRLEME